MLCELELVVKYHYGGQMSLKKCPIRRGKICTRRNDKRSENKVWMRNSKWVKFARVEK